MRDLILMMAWAQYKYIAPKMTDKLFLKHFTSSMNDLYYKIQSYDDPKFNMSDVEYIKLLINDFEGVIPKKRFIKKILFIQDSEINAKLFLINMMNDIVKSVDVRFVSGGEKVYLGLFKLGE